MPRSLAGQLALLVGVALFVAQAINFALLLGERRERRNNQLVGPAIVRLVNAADRIERGAPRRPRRDGGARRVQVTEASLVTTTMVRRPAIEAEVRSALAQAGLAALDVRAAETERTAADRPMRRAQTGRASGRMLLLSVQTRPDIWLNLRTPVRDGDGALVARLLGQTAILYLVLLAGVLWIGRRTARPLRELTNAAAGVGLAGPPVPIAERGPTDIRALTAAFNAMRERLATILTEKDRMLGAIGHDLRTPLASLRLRAETHPEDAERARMAETIDEMRQTLDDILSLSKIGRTREPAARVDLSALVDAVVEDLRDLGGDLAFEPSPRVVLDLRPVLTRRAIRNLIDNALKYGSRAAVRVRAEGKVAVVEIDDEGPGLPREALASVFDSFTRLETSRNRDTGGAGLGLALARAIVRDQGGDIVLENRVPAGLRATIRLPLTGSGPPASGGNFLHDQS